MSPVANHLVREYIMAPRQSYQRNGSAPLIDMAALGERLRWLRQWKRYSQASLAQRAGVDVMVISRLEAV